MGDHDRDPAFEQALQCLLDVTLGTRVEGLSRLIQNRYARVAEESPGNSQALFLATGQRRAALSDFGP
jgi:hypothetical protein